MGFFSKLFGVRPAAVSPAEVATSALEEDSAAGRPTLESDNIGMRHETRGEGEAYFASLLVKDAEALLFYFFDERQSAENALLELPCIMRASDTGNLICTEVLSFGVFPAVDSDDTPTWGALLAGKGLGPQLWQQARAVFARNHGRARREEEPPPEADEHSPQEGDPNAVEFSHERREIVAGAPAIYRHYQAPDKLSAVKWLQQHPVKERGRFLVIDTPDGTFARDVQGIFET